MTRFAVAVLAVLALVPLAAEAMWTDLTPEQTQEAIAHGKATYERWRTEGRPIDYLDPEYVVDLGRETGQALLYTGFSTLALEARRWRAIGQQLKPDDIERIVAPTRLRLGFLVIIPGSNRDFLRHYTVRLVQGGASQEPTAWDVFRGDPIPNFPGRYEAVGQYTFRVKDLDPAAPVTLVVRSPEGQETRFDFDLGRLK